MKPINLYGSIYSRTSTMIVQFSAMKKNQSSSIRASGELTTLISGKDSALSNSTMAVSTKGKPKMDFTTEKEGCHTLTETFTKVNGTTERQVAMGYLSILMAVCMTESGSMTSSMALASKAGILIR